MKHIYAKILVCLFVITLLASCGNVRRINKPNSSHRAKNNVENRTTKPPANSATTKERSTEMTNNDVHALSMKELKQYGSNLTDYCISWVGTPYRAGGTTKKGVDCSGCVCIFFGKGRINHVGIFIRGNKFIHASSSKGVIVSSLEEKYWKENYNSCGHHPQRN